MAEVHFTREEFADNAMIPATCIACGEPATTVIRTGRIPERTFPDPLEPIGCLLSYAWPLYAAIAFLRGGLWIKVPFPLCDAHARWYRGPAVRVALSPDGGITLRNVSDQFAQAVEQLRKARQEIGQPSGRSAT